MIEKKILIFDGKMFYNARHLYEYLHKHYSSIYSVTYLQVQEATGKRLKSIGKFFKVDYEYVNKMTKDKIKRYMQISEGYEEIIAFETKSFDDFIIKYLAIKEVGFLFVFRNTKKEIMLAFKPQFLKKLADKYKPDVADLLVERMVKDSVLKDHFYYYVLKPTNIKQNIF